MRKLSFSRKIVLSVVVLIFLSTFPLAARAWDNGVALTATLTQPTNGAATKATTLTLPAGLGPRLSAIARACAAPDPASCPASAK